MEALDEDPNVLESTRVDMMDAIDEDHNALVSLRDDVMDAIYEDPKTEKSVNLICHPPRINTVRVGSPDMFPQLDPNYESDCECTPSLHSV